MPSFWRNNADFVGVPFYAGVGGVPQVMNGGSTGNAVGLAWGHSPIDITLLGLAANWVDTRNPGSAPGIPQPDVFQAWVDGVLQDFPLNVGSGQHRWTTFESPILIPKVTPANFNGASRFAVQSLFLDDNEMVTLDYVPTNAADIGKEVWALGSNVLAGPASGGSNGRFAPPNAYWFGWPGGWSYPGGDSDIFASEFELVRPAVDDDSGADDGDVKGIAAVPFCQPTVWDDFTIVLRNNPDGTYNFNVRVEGATVKTLTVTASTQRVWTFPGTVGIQAGQRACWQYVGVDGAAGLDGEILWTSRAGADNLGPGAGESAGESIP